MMHWHSTPSKCL